MAIFHYDNLAKNLPDCYKKDESSNNFKILKVEKDANDATRSALNSIDNILNIENATGATLDMYGERFGQPRGNASDAQYRIMIKAKIVRSFCGGNYKDIIDAICYTFNCGIDDVLIADTGEPRCVTVYKTPLPAIISAGFSINDAEKIISTLLPVGTILESVMFDGTFEFGREEYETGIENDPETGDTIYTGFVNADGEGGYLGYASSSETEGDLPI